MSTLELVASQAVLRARLLERAVHDEGPWFVRWGALNVPAQRHVSEDSVLFVAEFPKLATPVGHDRFELWCRDAMLSVKEAPANPEGDFIFQWTVGVPAKVA